MNTIPLKEFHPGIYLLEELQARKISQITFAKVIGKTTVEVNDLIKGRRNITSEWAMLISAALGTSPQVWTNLQQNFDIKMAQKKFSANKIKLIQQKAVKYFLLAPQFA